MIKRWINSYLIPLSIVNSPNNVLSNPIYQKQKWLCDCYRIRFTEMFIDSSKKMTTQMQLNTNNNDNYHEGSARAIWIALFECGLPTTMSKHCLQLSATYYYCFFLLRFSKSRICIISCNSFSPVSFFNNLSTKLHTM